MPRFTRVHVDGNIYHIVKVVNTTTHHLANNGGCPHFSPILLKRTHAPIAYINDQRSLLELK